MADDVVIPTAVLPGGVAREGWKTPAPPRSTMGYLWDQGIGVAQGAIDVLQTPVALARDVADPNGPSGGDAAAQTVQHIALDTKNWLGRQKTGYAQEEEARLKAGGEDERGIAQEAGEMVVGTAAPLAAAAATGPLAPLTFGALSVGASSLSAEETLRNMSEEDLKKTPKYSEFRRQGMNDAEARRATYHEMRTLESIAPDLVMNTIFGGVAGRLVGKAFSRTTAGSMTQRIMRTLGQDVPEGIIGGAASGAATSYSRQQGEVQGGLRQEVDWGEVGKAGIDVGRPAGVISTAVALGRGARRPHAPGAAPGKTSTEKIFGEVDKATPEIGTEVKAVAGENLTDKPVVPEAAGTPGPVPPAAGEAAPPVAPRGVDRPAGEAAAPAITDEIYNKINARRADKGLPPLTPADIDAQVARAGAPAEINPEGASARVMPPRPVDEAITPIDPATAPRLRDVDAIRERLDHLEGMGEHERAMPEWRAEHQKLSEEYDQLAEAGAPARSPSVTTTEGDYTVTRRELPGGGRAESGAPTRAAPRAEVTPAGKPFTREALKARLGDLEQTPTMDAFQAHVKEWRAANKGEKLPEHNQLQKAWTKAVGAVTKTRTDAEALQKKTAREARVEAAKSNKAKQTEIKEAERKLAETTRAGGIDVRHPNKEVEAKRKAVVAHERAATGKQMHDPAWIAKHDQLYDAYRDAETAWHFRDKSPKAKPKPAPGAKGAAVKAKAKAVAAKKVTPPSKPEPPPPPAADVAALKAEPEPPPPPPAKPTLTLKGEPPPAAAAAVAAAKLVKKADTPEAQAKRAKDNATKQDQRDRRIGRREDAAKSVVAQRFPGVQERGEWDAREAAISEGKVEEVLPQVKDVADIVDKLVRDYEGELKILRGGNEKHEIYNLGQLLGKDEAGNEVRGKARAAHGEHHSFMADLYNRNKELQTALKRADNEKLSAEKRLEAATEAKDMVSNFLDNFNLVREGKISEFSAKKAARNEAIATKAKEDKTGQEGLDLAEAKRAAAGLDPKGDVTKVAEQEVRTTAQMSDAQLAARGLPTSAEMRKMMKGRRPGLRTHRELRDEDKTTFGHDPKEWVDGVRLGRDEARTDAIMDALDKHYEELGSPARALTVAEVRKAVAGLGETVQESTLGKEMAPWRPDNPIMATVFDAVHRMVKDMPSYVMSPELVHALNKDARAFYAAEWGATVFRPDTRVQRTVIHEALHAATARALYGSQRLQHLVSRIQDIVARKYQHDPKMLDSLAFRKAIASVDDEGNVKTVDQHEFLSELFTRYDVKSMVQDVVLRPRDLRDLRREGYAVDKGKGLFGAFWDVFLKVIKFKAETPNAFKVAVDMLQDTFDREMEFRALDVAEGRTDIGKALSENEMAYFASLDPVHGTAAHRAIMAGNHAEAANSLMNMADKMDDRALDSSVRYLKAANDRYWGPGVHNDTVTLPSKDALRGEFSSFLNNKLGKSKGAMDLGYQIRNKFATPLRHLSQGIRYTNDLGNNLEEGFKKILQPLKDAWSKREHFTQEYMDSSGADRLIDNMARVKNAITDRALWDNFERLMIRESYARAFADEDLGAGRNKHIDPTSRRDRQTVADHKINRELYEKHVMNHPQLKDLRNEVHAFMAKEMEARHKYMARDMILKWNVAKSGDDDAISALVKNIRHEDASMTPKEKAAFDRAVGAHDSEAYKDWTEKRTEVRRLIQENTKAGPHVPFMRHGKHVVYAEYEVKPDAGVAYNEVNPELTGDVHKMYDFVHEKDADNFIDNTLNHPDVEINVRNAHEIVYDTTTGKRASVYTDEEMKAFADKGEKHANRYLTSKDIRQMKENDIATDHLQVRHRVEFNPTEYVRFESEREAHDFREMRNADHSHPNVSTKVSHVETPKDLIGRANVAYTSAELQQWINRMEASPAYQKMTEEQKNDWKREMRIEAARVTMTAGRRTMMMPREYAKGASLNILKNTIDFAGNNARAHAELMYRDDIDKARQAAHDYTDKFRNSAGRPPGATEPAFTRDQMLEQTGHRARQDVLREIDRRLFAPPQVEGTWAKGIKRALQVSMISHLADTGYLMVNAMEPWIFGAAITASRHGFKSYSSLAEASALIDPHVMAKQAFLEFVDAGKATAMEAIGKDYVRTPVIGYEKHLLKSVTGPGNKRGDGARLDRVMRHMFSRGLVARDVGMEMERVYDPSGNRVFRVMDNTDAMFRAANTGIETGNRAIQAISNFRLEYDRAIKDGLSPDKAEAQALRYAEDMVFKGAGDYSSWNNPRYMNNPYLKLGGQFKKYSLRIASVWGDAMIQAARGDREKQKQIAFMFVAQALAGGAFSTPLSVIPGGLVNAMYILGATDDNWEDWMFEMRKALADQVGLGAADAVMNGVLDMSGANFSSKFDQSNMVFFGDPESRDPAGLFGAMGKLVFGAPGNAAMKLKTGVNKTFEAYGHFDAGADEKGWQAAAEATENIIQIKQLHDIVKAVTLANKGPTGMPTGNEASTIQAAVQAIGFTPTEIARKQEEKRVFKREMKKESVARNVWVGRWQDAPNPAAQNAIWANIQRDYNAGIKDSRLHITRGELQKAQQRKKREQARDSTKLGVKMSGRQKAFADIHGYYNAE